MRKWASRLGFVLFLVLFCEFFLQGFYRFSTGEFLWKRSAIPSYAPDPDSGWRAKPSMSYRHTTNEFSVDLFTNKEGFRVSSAHEEYAVEKDPKTYRILLLGPSFAFGWAVNFEDTFAKLLRDDLEKAGYADGRPIEMINRGVPALPPANNLAWFKKVGKTYSPDLVIQFVYGSMAVDNRFVADNKVDEDGYLVRANVSTGTKMKAKLKNSALVFYGWMVQQAMASRSPEKIEGSGRELKSVEAFDPASPTVKDSMAFYDDLNQAVTATGAKLLVVYFPLAYGVHKEDIERWRHQGVRDVAGQIAFDDAFSKYLNSQGITTLDLTGELTKAAETTGKRLYYKIDVHWTPEGNQVAERCVADYLLGKTRTPEPTAAVAPSAMPPQ
ncbi:MAG: hypothetical protein U1D30_03210 [Planctomycetota bacterium]